MGAVAFLHQHQRRQGQAHGIAFIEAVPDDYELAAQLMQRCLGYAFEDLSPKAQELYACVQRLVREHHQTTVTRGDICRWTGLSLPQVRKLLAQLIELGYLRALKGSQGQEYVYQLIESPRPGSAWSGAGPGQRVANGRQGRLTGPTRRASLRMVTRRRSTQRWRRCNLLHASTRAGPAPTDGQPAGGLAARRLAAVIPAASRHPMGASGCWWMATWRRAGGRITSLRWHRCWDVHRKRVPCVLTPRRL